MAQSSLTITKSEPLGIAKAEQAVTTSDGQTHYVPVDASEARISAITGAIPAANAPLAPKARTWSRQSDVGGLGLALAAKAVPGAATALQAVASNPNVPAVAGKIGRLIGNVAPAAVGAYEDGAMGAIAGMTAARVAKSGRIGAGIGTVAGKVVQRVAGPVAKVLKDVAPYAQALSTLGGVQGGLDLAQMAEPSRTDIGVLGVGTSDAPRSAAEKAAHPALINLAVAKVSEAVKYLMDQGLKQSEAVRLVMNAKAKGSK